MCLLEYKYYQPAKDDLHPNRRSFVNHYRCGNLVDLPVFQGCNKVNKNGTRKLILYEIGEQCVAPTEKNYWRKPKAKYRTNIGFFYQARYMTQTNFRNLFKNRGNFAYSYRLKNYEHMSKTPMKCDFKKMQDIKKDLWKHALK